MPFAPTKIFIEQFKELGESILKMISGKEIMPNRRIIKEAGIDEDNYIINEQGKFLQYSYDWVEVRLIPKDGVITLKNEGNFHDEHLVCFTGNFPTPGMTKTLINTFEKFLGIHTYAIDGPVVVVGMSLCPYLVLYVEFTP